MEEKKPEHIETLVRERVFKELWEKISPLRNW
jgi:hypothetical protein